MNRYALGLCCALTWAGAAHAQRLFVGLEGSEPVTRSTDLAGFPDVVYEDHFAFDVSGAAATPDGTLYLCNGPFTTNLYESTLEGPPQLLATLSEDMSALAFGRGALYGYSNYADPKGIYQIDTATGECTLVLDVYTNTGFRFFALDYNPVDDLFYGYTEYGDNGLYSINIDTGEMIKLAGSIPASNGQGRGMAVGNDTVYLTATRGDDGIPFFAYDLSQGVGGEWTPFTQAYPAYHSTGGAAWIPDPYPCPWDFDGDDDVDTADLLHLLGCWGQACGDVDGDGDTDTGDLLSLLAAWGDCPGPPCPWDFNGDDVVDEADRDILIDHWGDCPDPPAECPWDLNGDGSVNGLDLVILEEHYGPCPE
jgi:hypothetical protein